MSSACLLSLALVLPMPEPAHQDVGADLLHHDLEVRLEPGRHHIEVRDRIELPAELRRREGVKFRLHAGLEITACEAPFEITALSFGADPGRAGINDEGHGSSALRLRTYLLRPGELVWPDGAAVTIHYRGEIHHPLVAEEQEYARSFSRTPGIIDERGVVLSGSSWWLPTFGEQLTSFRLAIDLPAAWDAVSQGRRGRHRLADGRREVLWDCVHPMDEVYLIAGPFSEYSRPAGAALARVFLRTPDPNLAAKYLEATAQYLEMYRKLIGPYPYAKFALVENFWETGYGMPSFTLLGPKIIRFPFILHSSYPHEILHNWWGNSVFVDYARGNWCEGLTAYLADHLIKEGQGRGAEYRRSSLERYRNYVLAGKDFPLSAFRARHSSATEAVGYGKALMLFHMLRRRLGDERFQRGLQRLYREFKFRRASFDDIAAVFSAVADEDLGWFFEQWVQRTGAPALALGAVSSAALPGGRQRLQITLRQSQQAPPYRLDVPLAVQLEGRAQPWLSKVELSEREQSFELALPARALRVQVDPSFDLFRRLDRAETPATVGQLFGAPRVLLVLPGDEDPLGDAWKTLVSAWSGGRESEVRAVRADEIEELPGGSAIWILGSANRWARALAGELTRFGAGTDKEWISFGQVKVPRAGHCFVYATAHPNDPESAIGWIGASRAAALAGLARKLPHYGKYSYLAFSGDEPTNDAKGQWPALGSPLVHQLVPGPLPAMRLPAGQPLARLAPVFDPQRIMAHVRYLAADEREGRGVGTAGLDQAGEWIAKRFEEIGLEPGGDGGTYFHSWYEPGGPRGKVVLLRNVIGVLPGSRPEWKRQSVVAGAHYDHLGRGWPDVRAGMAGQIHNGADDNASGVAVLIEVARLLAAELHPERTIVFCAFSGEEWNLRGSREYVRSMKRWPITDVLAMVNVDTVGRLNGAKLQILGTGSASEWVHIAMGIGFTTGVESSCIPDDPEGSDQKSFLEAAVPAVQLFSGPHADYHRPSDDVDKIDPDGLVAAATFLREALVYLSEREKPLSSNLAKRAEAAAAGHGQEQPRSTRRVSLGTMPDFAFAGPGVRAAAVMANSPAARAGIQVGDVLLALDGKPIADLRSFSDLLKTHAPGDQVRIKLRRKGRTLEVAARLGER